MFEKQLRIPEPEEIKQLQPLTGELRKIKEERDAAIADVLTGKSDKLIIIVGPCSAHAEAPVLDYVERLGKLNEKVKDKLVLVPRIYTKLKNLFSLSWYLTCFKYILHIFNLLPQFIWCPSKKRIIRDV